MGCAVIVHEFGQIGIDNDLVLNTDEDVIEMNNGCICCTVRGDLIRILGNIIQRDEHLDGILLKQQASLILVQLFKAFSLTRMLPSG